MLYLYIVPFQWRWAYIELRWAYASVQLNSQICPITIKSRHFSILQLTYVRKYLLRAGEQRRFSEQKKINLRHGTKVVYVNAFISIRLVCQWNSLRLSVFCVNVYCVCCARTIMMIYGKIAWWSINYKPKLSHLTGLWWIYFHFVNKNETNNSASVCCVWHLTMYLYSREIN